MQGVLGTSPRVKLTSRLQYQVIEAVVRCRYRSHTLRNINRKLRFCNGHFGINNCWVKLWQVFGLGSIPCVQLTIGRQHKCWVAIVGCRDCGHSEWGFLIHIADGCVVSSFVKLRSVLGAIPCVHLARGLQDHIVKAIECNRYRCHAVRQINIHHLLHIGYSLIDFVGDFGLVELRQVLTLRSIPCVNLAIRRQHQIVVAIVCRRDRGHTERQVFGKFHIQSCQVSRHFDLVKLR